ncbi:MULTISPECIES: hypothetical protein [Streptomyces]|nr:hypothetical protein [Streptomyces sp. Tue 6075]
MVSARAARRAAEQSGSAPVPAEQRSPEDIATPLSAVEAEGGNPSR